MRKGRIMAVAVLALVALAALRQPNADIRILTHDSGDTAPHKVQAALDLGILAVNVLVTWTGRHVAG
jgi:hypothetical protein